MMIVNIIINIDDSIIIYKLDPQSHLHPQTKENNITKSAISPLWKET